MSLWSVVGVSGTDELAVLTMTFGPRDKGGFHSPAVVSPHKHLIGAYV